MVIQHNLSAMNADRQLGLTVSGLAKSTEKLSSGYRINRAADDAAGLTISEKMRRQMRGLDRASQNAQDGISMIQTAEGALNEVHEMLQRCNELAIQSANGTNSASDREAIDAELQQLKTEIDRVAQTTKFNETYLFDADSTSSATGKISTAAVDEGIQKYGASTGSKLADKIIYELMPNVSKQILDAFPSLDAATAGRIGIGLDIEQKDGVSGTLAYASFRYSYMGSTVTSKTFSVLVDKDDFNINDAYDSGSQAEVLESTMAHELTHTVMQNTLLPGMAGFGEAAYSSWFKEGTAQLSGGGFPTNWNYDLETIAGRLSGAGDTSQDANIEAYLKSDTVDNRVYGHGYLAAAYVGYLADGTNSVTSGAIANGMDKVFTKLLAGKSLDDAISETTGKTTTQIKDAINTATADGVEFVRKLSFNSRGGAGSVITSSLSVGGTDIIGSSVTDAQKYYIDEDRITINGKKVTVQRKGTESAGSNLSLASMESVNLHVGADADMTNKIGIQRPCCRDGSRQMERDSAMEDLEKLRRRRPGHVRRCDVCGSNMEYSFGQGAYLCRKCNVSELDTYGRIKALLETNPRLSKMELASMLHLPIRELNKYIRNGVLVNPRM